MVLLTGGANPALGQEIAKLLGIRTGNVTLGRFPEGEIQVQIHDNIREKCFYHSTDLYTTQ